MTRTHDLPDVRWHQLSGNSLPQSPDDTDLRLKGMIQSGSLRTSMRPNIIPLAEVFSSDLHSFAGPTNRAYPQVNCYSSMSAEEPALLTTDPIVNILAAFHSIPNEYHVDLFNDFRVAAEARDLRQLLDTISDWAATAELYAHPTLAADLREAIGGRKGVADWLPG